MIYEDYGVDSEQEMEDEENLELTFYQICVTKEQIEYLLVHGNVDTQPIEVECNDCSTEITIFPTLILDK